MKQSVAVYNNGDCEYVENWLGVTYKIPSKKAIALSRRDAVSFLGTYGGSDPQDPKKPKEKALMIKDIEDCRHCMVNEYPTKNLDRKEYVSNLNGQRFESQEALDRHYEENKSRVMKSEEDQPKNFEDPVKCPYCGKPCKGKTGLKLHLRSDCIDDGVIEDDTDPSISNDQEPG